MTDEKATVATDNIFADLGFANPEEEMLKAKLVREIRGVIKSRRLTQAKAAALIGVKQPDVSSILAGRTHKYSIDRLLRCLHRLDCEVEISVRQKPVRFAQAGTSGLRGFYNPAALVRLTRKRSRRRW